MRGCVSTQEVSLQVCEHTDECARVSDKWVSVEASVQGVGAHVSVQECECT